MIRMSINDALTRSADAVTQSVRQRLLLSVGAHPLSRVLPTGLYSPVASESSYKLRPFAVVMAGEGEFDPFND